MIGDIRLMVEPKYEDRRQRCIACHRGAERDDPERQHAEAEDDRREGR